MNEFFKHFFVSIMIGWASQNFFPKGYTDVRWWLSMIILIFIWTLLI